MFKLRLYGEKHKKPNNRKYALHSMLRKGNKKAHITSEAKNSGIVKVECNKEVISKIINTVYFNVRKIFL